MKTTIILDDDLYKKLENRPTMSSGEAVLGFGDQALERYGSTRKLSLLINEKLRGLKEPRRVERKRKRRTYRLGRDLSPEQIDRLVEGEFGGGGRVSVIDTNVLVYDTFEDTSRHAEARALLDSLLEWRVPTVVFVEFVAFLSRTFWLRLSWSSASGSPRCG